MTLEADTTSDAQVIILRSYQDESVDGLRDGIRTGKKNQVLCAPTGSGKTVIAAYLLHECYTKGKRGLFVCDRIALIDQTSAVLDSYGIPHGVIQGNHSRREPGRKIQVASAQTLGRRGWPAADLIIVDECHTKILNTLEKIGSREAVTIGLSATPFSDGLGVHYDGIVNVTTTNELIAQGFLVPPKFFAAKEPDMKGAKVVAGEWTDGECSARAMPIVGDAVSEYLKRADGKKFIAFGCDVNHCEELRRQFLAAGIRCELYTYKTGDDERTAILKEFRLADSSIRGLVSVSALSKGFDAPDVGCIICCRPLRKSLTEHIQVLGRGLRMSAGKTECVILDLAGNTKRFWDDMWEFFENGIHELDDGTKAEKKKKEKKEREPMKCPQCHCVHDPRPSCPSCGWEYPRKPAVQHEAGELHELGAPVKGNMTDKQHFHAMLVATWEDHNAEHPEKLWKPGWIAMKYRDRFGVWPKGLDTETAMTPSPEFKQWMRAQFIRWKKSQEKQSAVA